MSQVCVHGLGYIGLSTGAMLANSGHEVVGFDTEEAVRDRIERRNMQFDEPDLDALVSDALAADDLLLTDEPEPADYHLVCVPTPLDETAKRADRSAVGAASTAIADLLRTGDTVIVESTVPPGTTAEFVRPILEESGLDARSNASDGDGRADPSDEFLLAYSPETVLPSDVVRELRKNDRIVGGVCDRATRSAVELYDSFVDGTIYQTDATTAEFAKLAQNTYRDVNIALANEFAKLARDYGIDARETIDLGNTHPRVDIHRPGPGVGGHCVPVDPWFLGEGSEHSELVEHAREINDGMVEYVAELLRVHLGDLSGRKIAVLGVAYKGNVADSRQSPTLRFADVLADAGADARFHDPYVEDTNVPLSSLNDATAGADALVVMTDHDDYRVLNLECLADRMATRVVVDTMAIIDRATWAANGFDVSQV